MIIIIKIIVIIIIIILEAGAEAVLVAFEKCAKYLELVSTRIFVIVLMKPWDQFARRCGYHS